MEYWFALAIVTFPLIVLLSWGIFDGWGDFLEAVKHIFTPDIISAFSGEYGEDRWNSLKIHIVLAVWVLAALGVHAKWSEPIKEFIAEFPGAVA